LSKLSRTKLISWDSKLNSKEEDKEKLITLLEKDLSFKIKTNTIHPSIDLLLELLIQE